MAAVPGENAGEQTNSATDAHKEDEWFGPSWNAGHFLLFSFAMDTKIAAIFFSEIINQTRGL
jgi:hypothetical protein